MFKSTLIAAIIAISTLGALSTGASAMPGAAKLQPAVETNQNAAAGGAQLIKVGRFKRRFKFRFRHHRFHRFHGHGHGCFWLKRKAKRTGKIYWWKRYYRCIGH